VVEVEVQEGRGEREAGQVGRRERATVHKVGGKGEAEAETPGWDKGKVRAQGLAEKEVCMYIVACIDATYFG
jgi:hypothetical protein